MNSSGIKRGLAVSAVSAMAVAGLPFLAFTASATPISASGVGADNVEFYSQDGVGISDKNDGTNTTVSLVTGGGANVTSVLYQYESSTAPGTWVDVPGGLVARNADGVFAYDWAGVPDTVTRVRAVPNTGVANAVIAVSPTVLPDAAANTVELASEGALGVFQEPYAGLAGNQELVGVTGTVSQGSGAPTVKDMSHTGNSVVSTLETTADTASDTFNARLNIAGYTYSSGSEPNQIALNAKTSNTDDAEGSTLYVQTIGSITATPATQDDVTPADAKVTLTVLDTTGKPVAGAEVYRGSADTDTDLGGPDTDTDGPETLVGYTDGRGQVTDTPGGAGTWGYYVNTTNNTAYQAGTDPSTTSTITTYTPTLGEVDIVNIRNRANFDLDELADGDDFKIVTKDQKGNPFNEDLAGADIEYRWVIDPSAAGEPTYTQTPWRSGETAANGEFAVPGLADGADYDGSDADTLADDDLPEGTYTLEARRPNVGGTGLKDATPETVKASESEITFADGNSVNAPLNGDKTITGTLANDDGALAGRGINLNYTPAAGGDADFAPQSAQPAGVDVTPDAGGPGSTATVATGADGTFSVVLRDPAIPANVTPTPENGGYLNAKAQESLTDATSLQGTNGVDDPAEPVPPLAPATVDNAEENIVVNWIQAPAVTSITIAQNTLDPRNPAVTNSTTTSGPGVPVDLDIQVFGADGPDAGTDPDPIGDADVEVTVDKGFLSPNAENANDAVLATGHDAPGDLWGFFKNDGTSKSLQTTESGTDTGKTGAVVAIEDDADFEDDGLTDITVTVKSGSVTETRTITMDARVLTNLSDASLEPAAGEPSGDVPTDQDVEFQLYNYDQFDNLVGDEFARITDDSTVADFDTDGDFGQTLSDFTTSAPGIRAFSDAPTTQTLTATQQPGQVLVGTNSDPISSSRTVMTDSDPINWVEPTKVNAALSLKGGDNGAADDSLFANAIRKTEGATVTLFRKRADGSWKKIREGIMNGKGNYRFKNVADKNGNKKTRYKAVVEETALTNRGTGKKTVR